MLSKEPQLCLLEAANLREVQDRFWMDALGRATTNYFRLRHADKVFKKRSQQNGLKKDSVMLSGVSSSMVNILAVGIRRPVIMGLDTVPPCRNMSPIHRSTISTHLTYWWTACG